ncbi:hypothetical protein VNO77_13826 [Canavalia gladiata]|uniref:Uncharacterized protein n=1 Tax=Canavalia gladiata TaxID=3824 RepID=A0AAN9LYC9_CANGL
MVILLTLQESSPRKEETFIELVPASREIWPKKKLLLVAWSMAQKLVQFVSSLVKSFITPLKPSKEMSLSSHLALTPPLVRFDCFGCSS